MLLTSDIRCTRRSFFNLKLTFSNTKSSTATGSISMCNKVMFSTKMVCDLMVTTSTAYVTA